MIIQLRGTSGSGKTTAMRHIMETVDWSAEYVEGRKKPAYYVSMGYDGCPPTAVLGHYENVCGGCDTFKNYDQLLHAARLGHRDRLFVLMEGLMISDDVRQTVELHNTLAEVRCYFLVTPLDVCIANVKKRRAGRGQGPAFNEEKLRNRAAQIERTIPRLREAGIPCRHVSCDQAVRLVTGLLYQHRREETHV